MKNETTKTTLGEYLEAKKELAYWAAKVAELEPLELYRSPSVSVMPSGGGAGNAIEVAVVELQTAREERDKAEAKAKEAMARVLGLIQQVQTADQRAVLLRRYIDGLGWEEIAEAEGKSKTWATNLHGTALKYLRAMQPGGRV